VEINEITCVHYMFWSWRTREKKSLYEHNQETRKCKKNVLDFIFYKFTIFEIEEFQPRRVENFLYKYIF
jgi:hypothetical protein